MEKSFALLPRTLSWVPLLPEVAEVYGDGCFSPVCGSDCRKNMVVVAPVLPYRQSMERSFAR